MWAPDDLAGLEEAIAFGGSGIRERERMPLWDAPILYIVLRAAEVRRMVPAAVLGRHLMSVGVRLQRPRLGAAGVALALAPVVWAAPHVVVVAGLGGEPTYASAFVEQAQATANAVERLAGGVTLLVGEDAGRNGIRRAFAAHEKGRAEDPVVVVLIGHGSYDGKHYRFNVPGSDPTADDLAEWLARLPSERINSSCWQPVPAVLPSTF